MATHAQPQLLSQALAAHYGANEMLSLRSTVGYLNAHSFAAGDVGDAVAAPTSPSFGAGARGARAYSYSSRDVYLEQDALMVPYTVRSVGRVFTAVLLTVYCLTLLADFLQGQFKVRAAGRRRPSDSRTTHTSPRLPAPAERRGSTARVCASSS